MATLQETIENYINKTACLKKQADFEIEEKDIEVIDEPVTLLIDGKEQRCIFLIDAMLFGQGATKGETTYWEYSPGTNAKLEEIDITRIHDIAIVDSNNVVEQELMLTPEQEQKILDDNKQTLETDSAIWRACERYISDIEEPTDKEIREMELERDWEDSRI